MKPYEIRKAKKNDVPDVMRFINDHWARNHVLGKSETMFCWQYLDGAGLNFIIAEAEEKIIGVLGYVKYGECESDDIVLCLWKSISEKHPFLGVELLQYLILLNDNNRISCNGINLKTTKALYKFMGFKVDCLKHYYRLSDIPEYQIACINKRKPPDLFTGRQNNLYKIKNFETIKEQFDFQEYMKNAYLPKKSMHYIKHRFFGHPVYNYIVYGIKNEKKKISTLIFMREIACNGSKVLRIVDIIGEIKDFEFIGVEIQRLLDEEKYEYIDFMQNGIEHKILANAGFVLNEEMDENIIPNYFEPYKKENIKIWFATKYKENFIICKGDGDQDRPNKLED